MSYKKTAFTFLVLIISTLSFAQGITGLQRRPAPDLRHPHGRRPHIRSVQVQSHHVNVAIQSGVAVTKVTQVFHNPNGFMLEGSYLFPVPDRASITEFTMVMNGKEIRGEVLEKDKARRIYEGIVRSMRDPALLEYVGRDLFKASVFPIPARGEVKVSLTYVQELQKEGGVVEYRYPLKTQAFSKEAVGDIAVSVTIDDQAPIKSVFSSSHQLAKSRRNENSVAVSFEGKKVLASHDFHLFYTLSKSDVGLHLLSENTAANGGFFMMKLTPKIDFKPEEVVAREIIFVVDTSGSMNDDDKIEQAKSALVYGLRTLRPTDRFNIVTFSTEARTWASKMVDAEKTAVAEAITWVKKIKATGGTNIDEALTTALSSLTQGDRLPMVVFLTDGKPTVGETNEKTIIAHAAKANKSKARVFVFGVGYDVNARLLDIIAEDGHGARDYVTTSGNLELALSGFFDKVAFPVLTDVEIVVEGVKIEQVYPKNIGDLFKGSELTLLGKYQKPGNAVIRLRGKLGKGSKEYTFEQKFSDKKTGKDFISVLWAKRKVGYLWDQIRLKGENKELKDEIVRLGKTFAIATPYTSILVQEDGVVVTDSRLRGENWDNLDTGGVKRKKRSTITAGLPVTNPGAPGGGGSLGAVAGGKTGGRRPGRVGSGEGRTPANSPGPGGASGPVPRRRQAVERSLKAKEMREELSRSKPQDASKLSRIRVEGRSFTLVDKVWLDDGLIKDEKTRSKAMHVEPWSEAYFALIKAHPELGPIIAKLGEVQLKVGSVVYFIGSEKKEAPTPENSIPVK
ncbi:MAG: hypothetical protein ACI97A_000268 [Planctomycetota bacterium]|jgi:uncharacterized protein YegL